MVVSEVSDTVYPAEAPVVEAALRSLRAVAVGCAGLGTTVPTVGLGAANTGSELIRVNAAAEAKAKIFFFISLVPPFLNHVVYINPGCGTRM